MANKVLNFDQFMAEKNKDYIEVTVFGKTYKVKNDVPAIFPVKLARASESVNNGVVGSALMEAGEIMFGQDAVDEMCRNGISAKELGMLYIQVFNMVSGQNIDAEDIDVETYEDDASKVVKAGGKSTKK